MSDTPTRISKEPHVTDSGRYRLRGVLSRSTSSRVYLAEAPSDSRTVVVKQPASGRAADQEASILQRLGGNIAPQLLAKDTLDGRPVAVMEQLGGQSLLDLVHTEALSAESARFRKILEALASTLTKLHEQGIVHGDLKPDHVFFEEDGNVRLIDFAVAMADGQSPAAASDFAWATPGFAAPELLAAQAQLDGRADIFGFGAIGFWMATGRVPPSLGDPGALRGIEEQLQKSQLPEDLRAIILACLQPVPGNRPKDATRLLDFLAGRASPAAPQSQGSAESRDDIPPTVLVRRRRFDGPRSEEGQVEEVGRRRRASTKGVLLWLFLMLLIAGAVVAGIWYGKPLYDKHLKATWVIDPAGDGDALSLAEAVQRAGDDVTFLLAPGEYQGTVLEGGTYRIRPAEADAEAPVILSGNRGCLRAVHTQLSLEGLAFRGTGGQGGPACIAQEGGALRLLGSKIENVSGPGVVLRAGARGQIAESAIRSVAGDGVRAEGGGLLEILDTQIAEAGGNAVTAKGGTALTMRRNQITDTIGTGVLVAEGATARLEADLVQASKASGLEAASGARVEASDITLAASGGAGIYLHGQSRLVLNSSRVTGNGLSGIFGDDALRLEVQDSVITENGEHGILSLGTRSGRLTRNDVGLNGGYGLVLDPATRLETGGNIMESNGQGPMLDARETKPGGDEKEKETE